MTMNPQRLRKNSGPTPAFLKADPEPNPTPEPTPTQPDPQPDPQPNQPPEPIKETFEGLDPLTSSLVMAAPLVPVEKVAVRPKSQPIEEPEKAVPEKENLKIKKPVFLMAAAGGLAAGLLLFLGMKGRGQAIPAPNMGPSTANIPLNPPTPAPATSNEGWTVAGGRR